MKNVFSPLEQIDNIEAKVVAGIERLATVFKSSLQDTAKKYKLTPLQAQLLIFIAEHPAKLCSVTLLADEFSVTKATASDSLKTLVNKGYLDKVYNPNDARAFHLNIAATAKVMVNELSHFGLIMASQLKSMDKNELEVLSAANLKMLALFSKAGLISSRMCYSCHYYENKQDGFHCHLMNVDLPTIALRLDCPEHKTPK
ncbi:MAG: MarR family transcriptional regulator [Colwellia sp.]|nr:MarR family transcriptional regulator [Colwellia sp.]